MSSSLAINSIAFHSQSPSPGTQNIIFALAVIVVMVIAVMGFNLPLPIGVVAHEGSTVLVVLNGLRLLASGSR